MTERVTWVPDHGRMFNPPTDLDATLNEQSLDSCDAILIGLNCRRFVIVRPDEPQRDCWPVAGGWQKIRDLKPGDAVIYKGTPTIVQAVEVYR